MATKLSAISAGTFAALTDTLVGVRSGATDKLLTLTLTGTGSTFVMSISPTLVTPVLGAATGTSLLLSGLTASSAVATDGSKNLVSVTNTGSGNNVLATSPTLTTPIIGGGVFASKPGSPTTGQRYFATDLGTAGIEIVFDGTKWKPNGGSAIIHLSGLAATNVTGTASETNNRVVTIPAGLLSANGGLRITALGVSTGANSTKNLRCRWASTSAAVSGSNLIVDMQMSAAQLSESFIRTVVNRNATNSQVSAAPSSAGAAQATATNGTFALDTTAITYVNFNTLLANTADSGNYDATMIEWIEA